MEDVEEAGLQLDVQGIISSDLNELLHYEVHILGHHVYVFGGLEQVHYAHACSLLDVDLRRRGLQQELAHDVQYQECVVGDVVHRA